MSSQSLASVLLNRELESWGREIAHALRKIADVDTGTAAYAAFKRSNALRLLNWKVWSMRYHVSAEFILKTFYGYWRTGPKSGGGQVSLGLSINAVTGERARHILEDQVKLAFPHGEHKQAARADTMERLVNLRMNGSDGNEMDYRSAVLQKRRMSREGGTPKRPWRGNPWL